MDHPQSISRRFLLRGVVGAGATIATTGLLPLTQASAQTTGEARTVNANGVRLRSGAGTSFSVLATLASGTALTVVSTVTQSANGYTWINVKVNSSGVTGWIAAEFTNTAASGNWPAGTAFYVSNGPLNLRSAANGTIKKVIPTGTRGNTLGGFQNAGGSDWVSVRLSTGDEGWFAVQFITKGTGPGTPSGTTWPVGTAVYVDQTSLNLRNGASLSATVLGIYGWGVNAEVIGGPTVADGFTWYRVEIYSNGAVGWMAGEGLSKGTATPTTDRIRVVDGPVNLRSEPGLTKTVLASLPTGEGGDLWSTSSPFVDGYNWIRIRADSTQKIGWVATKFINYV
jgi:uncharacterized protein YgiM (DUF1202 family)